MCCSGSNFAGVLLAPGEVILQNDRGADGIQNGLAVGTKSSHLIQDVGRSEERREAVVGRVGAVAQHDQPVGAIASGNGGEKVGVGLVEKTNREDSSS